MLKSPERFILFAFVSSLAVPLVLAWLSDHYGGWPFQLAMNSSLDALLRLIPAVESNLEIYQGQYSQTGRNFLFDAYLLNFGWLLALTLILYFKRHAYSIEIKKRFTEPSVWNPATNRPTGPQSPLDIARYMSLFFLLGFAGLLFDVFEDSHSLPTNDIVVNPWSAGRFFVYDGFIMLGAFYVYFPLKIHYAEK